MNIAVKLPLGRLEKVDLRSYWEKEAIDFTPWLAEAENIQLLGDTIGLDLEIEAQEKEVGPFRADILCKDTANDQWVLIENQLERTDHIHLGQLLTYAAGLNAVTIVWIAARFTDEHRATLDWLNEITNEDFNFFGLEIELWRIGTSAIAPKFNMVSKPNNWSKTITGAAKSLQTVEQTEAKKLQYEYWTVFREYALENAQFIKPTKPLYQHWMNIALGRSGFILVAIASTWNSETQNYNSNETRAELNIQNKASKACFSLLKQQQSEIEREFGEALIWDSQPDRKSCRIYIRTSVKLGDRDDWKNQHQWLVEKLDKLHSVFAKRVQQLDLSGLSLISSSSDTEEP
ncbi:DUF4268 domain-containing protein [Leptolyngbya sp. NIES-2104]|uniref:DUF4268 domain-containing protein n=1 Tax=Leptolyngbya sp. NIES-2104 TaxID=1552121 RepID=UPI0006EC42DB|nr:DUF4268 domain-containing protein [Leptolyngbya sp. NIES-2104]GAP97087.1 hypothetical protein NIES2104_36340 [Leptolyngbya sp. NIES-2104]